MTICWSRSASFSEWYASSISSVMQSVCRRSQWDSLPYVPRLNQTYKSTCSKTEQYRKSKITKLITPGSIRSALHHFAVLSGRVITRRKKSRSKVVGLLWNLQYLKQSALWKPFSLVCHGVLRKLCLVAFLIAFHTFGLNLSQKAVSILDISFPLFSAYMYLCLSFDNILSAPQTRLSQGCLENSTNCSHQFSSVPWPIGSSGGTWRTIQQRSSSSLFCRRPLPAVLAWAGIYSTLWCCPSSISSAEVSVAHPPRCHEGRFWRGCRGVWFAQTMQVSVSWQLPEEVPVDPQGSGSCSVPSLWSFVLQVGD